MIKKNRRKETDEEVEEGVKGKERSEETERWKAGQIRTRTQHRRQGKNEPREEERYHKEGS